MQPQLNVNPLWLTPVWEVQTPFDHSFNETLLDEIYLIGKGITTGSDPDPHNSLWDYNTPKLNELKQYLKEYITQAVRKDIPEARDLNMSVDSFMCWPNVRAPGESLEIHAHTDSAIAATYFIKATADSGDLVLFDTSDCINWLAGTLSSTPDVKIKRITPVEGKLVFFPSYVLHTVEENKSNDLRVTITSDFKKVIDKNTPNSIVLNSWANSMVKIRE